jgi:hypothetical protein
MGGCPSKVRAVELRNGVLNISGCKLSALTVSAAYPDAVGRVSDDELTNADFWRGALEIRGDGGAGFLLDVALWCGSNVFPSEVGLCRLAHKRMNKQRSCTRLQRAGV